MYFGSWIWIRSDSSYFKVGTSKIYILMRFSMENESFFFSMMGKFKQSHRYNSFLSERSILLHVKTNNFLMGSMKQKW